MVYYQCSVGIILLLHVFMSIQCMYFQEMRSSKNWSVVAVSCPNIESALAVQKGRLNSQLGFRLIVVSRITSILIVVQHLCCQLNILTLQCTSMSLVFYSNVRRFYSSIGWTPCTKGLIDYFLQSFNTQACLQYFTLSNARRFYSV